MDREDGSPLCISIDRALPARFVLYDRDSKFCASFQETPRSAGVQPSQPASPQPESECVRRTFRLRRWTLTLNAQVPVVGDDLGY
jgi:hypothetical protein